MADGYRDELGAPVGEKLALGRSAWAWHQFVLFIVFLGGSLSWGITVLEDQQPGVTTYAMFGVGIVCLLAAVVSAIIRSSRKQFVQFFENGIAVSGLGTDADLCFDEIRGLKYVSKDIYDNGTYSGAEIDLAGWVGTNYKVSPKLRLKGKLMAKKPEHDRFFELVAYPLARMAELTQERLDAGEVIAGEGFKLDARKIQIGSMEIPIDRMAMVAEFEGKINVWETGAATPCASIKRELVNATLAMLVLEKRLESKDGEQELPGLGRILFDKRPGLIAKIVLALITLVIWFFAAFCALANGIKVDSLVIAGIIAIVGAPFAFAFAHTLRAHFRCFQKGVGKYGLFGKRELSYQDIGSFTYSSTRHYYNGAYTGTSMSMKFDPEPGVGAKSISYSCNIRNKAEDLDTLRDHIGRVIAAKFLAAVELGSQVTFAGNLKITRDGVCFNRSKFFGKGEEMDLTYDQVAGFNLVEGVFHLFVEGEEKSVFNAPVSSPNFFPVFFLLLSLKYPDSGEGQAAPENENESIE